MLPFRRGSQQTLKSALAHFRSVGKEEHAGRLGGRPGLVRNGAVPLRLGSRNP